MNIISEAGTPTRVTASGVTNITSGNAVLLGVMAGNGAQGTIDLFHGTATGTTTAIIASGVTLVTGVYTRFPANCSGGLTVLVTGFTTPNITFYWNPAART